MIGKAVDESEGSVKTLKRNQNPVYLEVKNLTSRGVFRDVSFQVRKGEIVGLGGLIGAGRTELVRCLYGIDRFHSGEILVDGKPYAPNAARSIKNGFGSMRLSNF